MVEVVAVGGPGAGATGEGDGGDVVVGEDAADVLLAGAGRTDHQDVTALGSVADVGQRLLNLVQGDVEGARQVPVGGGGAYGMVHWGSKVGNAFWNPDCGCMQYGDGDGSTFKNPLVVLDVTGHELSHGVVGATAGLEPTRIDSRGNQFGEPGALNESLADIFGSGMEFATNNSTNSPNYLLGEKLGLAQGFLRRLDQPSLDKLEGTVDYWSSKAYDTEVHAGSGISSHAFYLRAEGSGQKTIGNVTYNSATYDGSAVTGIGRAKALNIFYTALTSYMVSTTDFHDARTATLSAAKDPFGSDAFVLCREVQPLTAADPRLVRRDVADGRVEPLGRVSNHDQVQASAPKGSSGGHRLAGHPTAWAATRTAGESVASFPW